MVQFPLRLHRQRARWIFAFLGATLAIVVVLGSAARARAATLNSTTYDLQLMGHVKNSTGTQLSTEGYETTTQFNATFANLPNTIVPAPRPPFDAGDALRVSESEAGDTAIIWIRGPGGAPHTFANPLDPNYDVELDLTLRFSGLGPNEQVAITDVRPENGSHGFYNEVSYTTSGAGTAANPLLLSIRLDPADIQGPFSTSHVKVQLDFAEVVIPEPATWVMLSVALAGASICRRRGGSN
jgi:hypothetical protein